MVQRSIAEGLFIKLNFFFFFYITKMINLTDEKQCAFLMSLLMGKVIDWESDYFRLLTATFFSKSGRV